MKNITLNIITYDDFVVLDKKNDPVTGLLDGDFSKVLYDPNGDERVNISGGVPVSINELGNGVYRLNFTPDLLGNWVLVVYNATHFPWGKAQTYFCVTDTFDTVVELIRRNLGLAQENYRIINPQYDNRRNMTYGLIRIYPSAEDVDNDTNAIAEYEVSATYNKNKSQMTGYKVKKL